MNVLPGRFATEVRRARRRRGWSQLELAERADISVNHVGLIERGRRVPSIDVALRLASALGVTLDRLVHGSPQRWASEATTHLRALPPGVRRVVLVMLEAAAGAVRTP